MTYINDSMRAAVGRVTARQVSYPVSESDIRRWARAVYWPEVPPRLFWDKEYAERSRHGGIVAPEEFNAFAWMVAEKDDPPSAVQLAPIDPNRMEKLLGIEPLRSRTNSTAGWRSPTACGCDPAMSSRRSPGWPNTRSERDDTV